MKSKIYFQSNESDNIKSKLSANFLNNPKRVYFFSGNFKEGGFNILEEEFIDSNFKIFMTIGIDKKNTTKLMLDSLLKYTKDIYVFNNNDLIEFDSSICIFEFADKAVIYSLSSNFSESGLINNESIYLEMIYDLKDSDEKKEYKNMIKSIISKVESEDSKFKKLTKEMVNMLQEKKEIFTTKQYVHNVKSISELLGKETSIKKEEKKISKDEIEDIYVSNIEIPKIDIEDDDIDINDIDISEIDIEPEISLDNSRDNDIKEEKVIETKVLTSQDNNELIDSLEEDDNSACFDENETLDIGEMLFSKADIKLDVDSAKKTTKKTEEEKEVKELVKVKKLNLNNISNFIFELPTKTKTKQNENILKIPNYIAKMIPNFFEIVDNFKTVEIDNAIYKIRNINLEVVDVKTGNKYTDRDAKISYKVGQSFVVFSSDILKNIDYNELDIARIIKLDSKVYHIEIIERNMQEYKLWNKVCNQHFKSSNRKYGMM